MRDSGGGSLSVVPSYILVHPRDEECSVAESDLERELAAAIEDWIPSLTGRIQTETPLFESGQLDSLALLNLVTWIEDRTGTTVDVGSIDPVRDWSTVADILRYIERVKQ